MAKKFTRKPLSPEQREARRAEQREKIEAAVSALHTDEGWIRWIRSHKSLQRFSFLNRLLVQMQIPEKREPYCNADCMTRTHEQVVAMNAPYEVRTYNAWKKAGRQVRKGEKCLVVLQPIFANVKLKDENGNETGEEERRLVGFSGLSEFDITQTDGDPIPERHNEIQKLEGSEFHDILVMLIEYMESQGYTVNPFEILGQTNGYVDNVSKHIGLNGDNSSNQKLKTMIHEIAHTREGEEGGKIDYKNYSRADAEVIVETVTHMVSEFIGLDTSSYSFGYLAHWSRPDDPKVFQRFAKTIDKIANEIEDIIRKGTEALEDEAVAA